MVEVELCSRNLKIWTVNNSMLGLGLMEMTRKMIKVGDGKENMTDMTAVKGSPVSGIRSGGSVESTSMSGTECVPKPCLETGLSKDSP